jgi:hypothetical protein
VVLDVEEYLLTPHLQMLPQEHLLHLQHQEDQLQLYPIDLDPSKDDNPLLHLADLVARDFLHL